MQKTKNEEINDIKCSAKFLVFHVGCQWFAVRPVKSLTTDLLLQLEVGANRGLGILLKTEGSNWVSNVGWLELGKCAATGAARRFPKCWAAMSRAHSNY